MYDGIGNLQIHIYRCNIEGNGYVYIWDIVSIEKYTCLLT